MTVSIITPAYNNWADLKWCIASVEAQTYEDWQHVIVHDGPNPDMRDRLRNRGYKPYGKRVFVELGRNWHGFLGGDAGRTPGPGGRGGRGSRAVSAAHVASYLVTGDYTGSCDADCELLPEHLEKSMAAIERTGADLSYTQVERRLDGRFWDIVGNGRMGHGLIDGNSVVFKTELFQIANWRWGGDADWDILEQWLTTGAKYTFVPEVTVIWKHASNDI